MNQTRILIGLALGWLTSLLAPAVFADGLSQHRGRYIRLTTDLSSQQEAEKLVASFDAAAAQWIEFFDLTPSQVGRWQVDAFVMVDPSEFERESLIPPNLPDFPFGYTLRNRVWVRKQPSEYYTRHLLLHEGVHSLMYVTFQGAGSTWYQEGTAELLATHRGVGDQIEVNWVPDSRQQVPYWGRFKRMQQSRQEGTVPSLQRVFRYQADLKGDVETYGWSWALTMMLARYPESHPTLVAAARYGHLPGDRFNQQLQRQLESQFPVLAARWRLLVNELDYGFQWSKHRVAFDSNDPIWRGQPLNLTVAADQGWQSAGIRVAAGTRVKLQASGTVTLAETSRPWQSGPQGITYQYANGRPLGKLIACLLPVQNNPAMTTIPALDVQEINQQEILDVTQTSWLVLRVNDHVGKLDDNRGSFNVTITTP